MTFFELKPVAGETSFKTEFPSRGVVVPFVSFDVEMGKEFRQLQIQNVVSGVLPMAWLRHAAFEPAHVVLHTHTTQYTKVLDSIRESVISGDLPVDSLADACNEILDGFFDISKYDQEL